MSTNHPHQQARSASGGMNRNSSPVSPDPWALNAIFGTLANSRADEHYWVYRHETFGGHQAIIGEPHSMGTRWCYWAGRVWCLRQPRKRVQRGVQSLFIRRSGSCVSTSSIFSRYFSQLFWFEYHWVIAIMALHNTVCGPIVRLRSPEIYMCCYSFMRKK